MTTKPQSDTTSWSSAARVSNVLGSFPWDAVGGIVGSALRRGLASAGTRACRRYTGFSGNTTQRRPCSSRISTRMKVRSLSAASCRR
jgi:hypothetical protein